MKKYDYLHLGGKHYIDKDKCIGVFDLDNCTVSQRGRDVLNLAQKQGRIVITDEELPKSFILKTENQLILSQYNTKTIVN